jgi:cytochrome c oxidase subunit 2
MSARMMRALRVLSAVALGLAVLALVFPGGAGAVGGNPQTTLEPKSAVATMIDGLLDNIVLWCVAIFVIVEGALIVTVFRFRRRAGGPAPRPIHGNTTLEIAWTIIPAIILAFIAVPTVQTIFKVAAVPKDALQVRVIGHQWWWEFNYPTLGITTANELHVPAGRNIALELESVDVIHSFWIPAFAGKRDVIPGRRNHMWFATGAEGTFPGQCAEYCGTSHANMMFKVVSQPQAEFDAWTAQQKAPVPAPDSTTLAARGLAIYQKGLCVACHQIDGVSFGVVGPSLNKVATRTTIASGIYPNDPEHLKAWIKNAPAKKPGSLMPNMNLSDADVEALVAFLETRR